MKEFTLNADFGMTASDDGFALYGIHTGDMIMFTTGKFTRQMTAASLSELLKNPDVVLIGVNRDPPVFYPYKRKKGR